MPENKQSVRNPTSPTQILNIKQLQKLERGVKEIHLDFFCSATSRDHQIISRKTGIIHVFYDSLATKRIYINKNTQIKNSCRENETDLDLSCQKSRCTTVQYSFPFPVNGLEKSMSRRNSEQWAHSTNAYQTYTTLCRFPAAGRGAVWELSHSGYSPPWSPVCKPRSCTRASWRPGQEWTSPGATQPKQRGTRRPLPQKKSERRGYPTLCHTVRIPNPDMWAQSPSGSI